jgi:hypothetical protein
VQRYRVAMPTVKILLILNYIIMKSELNWRLVRERDGLTKHSNDIKWLEWNEDGTYKNNHPLPAPGLSLIMSPFNQSFTWQTTSVTEIVEQREDYIKFKTKNSNYELFKIK